MISDNRRDYSWREGRNSEERFKASCEKVGYSVRKSSKKDDIEKHIDFYITRSNGTFTSVDVKGANHPETIWVELKNVLGKVGWLFGKAEFIAFDMSEVNGFCMVRRTDLIRLVEEEVDANFVEKQYAYKKLYQRKNRSDVITKLHLTDIKKCRSFKILPYTE